VDTLNPTPSLTDPLIDEEEMDMDVDPDPVEQLIIIPDTNIWIGKSCICLSSFTTV